MEEMKREFAGKLYRKSCEIGNTFIQDAVLENKEGDE
jgi:hypothetical protein